VDSFPTFEIMEIWRGAGIRVEGAGGKTVIRREGYAKFRHALAPNQDPQKIAKAVEKQKPDFAAWHAGKR